MSADPALANYLGNRADKLPGQGGVFNPVNLALYHYAGNNPVKYVDPNGELVATALGVLIGGTAGGVSALIQGKKIGSKEFWAGVAGGAVSGAIVGLALDSVETFGLTGGAAAGIVITAGAIGGATGSITESVICGDKIIASNVVTDALIGSVSAFVGLKAGNSIVNKFQQKLFSQLKNPKSALYQAIHTLEGGTDKMMNILNSSKFAEILTTKGVDEALATLTDVLQDKINPEVFISKDNNKKK